MKRKLSLSVGFLAVAAGLVQFRADALFSTGSRSRFVAMAAEPEPEPRRWTLGNCNADDDLDVSDAIRALDYLFIKREEESAMCETLCDVDGNGRVSITDPILILQVLFHGEVFRTRLPAPVEVCGDGLDNDCNGQTDEDCLLTGASVELLWDAVTRDTLGRAEKIAGYEVHYGQRSGVHENVKQVGLALRTRIAGLTAGTRYYFAVKCQDSAGNTSLLSNEVSVLARP